MFEQETSEARPGVLRLGDLVPETKPVVINRDGRDVALRGYVWGRRIPRRVEARVSQAYNEFPKTVKIKTDDNGDMVINPTTGDPETEVKFEMTDYSDMLTRVACALVEGLSPIEAEVMSFDEIRELLTYLDYLKAAQAAKEAEPNNPLAGQATKMTGEISPSESQQPMASVGLSS